MQNRMEIRFCALSQNEAFARVAVGAFFSQLNPTIEELADVKTAVSEAVTNVIVHAYGESGGEVCIECALEGASMSLMVRDHGRGIANIEQAMQPFFTTGSQEERSGMGFMVMQAFMDEVQVESAPNSGTTVRMKKSVCGEQDADVA